MTEAHESAERRTERMRASDADRDRTVEQLRTHHEKGRLDATEFEERMAAALSARFCDELPPLLADLPPDGSGRTDEGAHRQGAQSRFAPPIWRLLPSLPLLPMIALLVIVASVVAGLHGHFPVLLVLGALLVWRLRMAPHRR